MGVHIFASIYAIPQLLVESHDHRDCELVHGRIFRILFVVTLKITTLCTCSKIACDINDINQEFFGFVFDSYVKTLFLVHCESSHEKEIVFPRRLFAYIFIWMYRACRSHCSNDCMKDDLFYCWPCSHMCERIKKIAFCT